MCKLVKLLTVALVFVVTTASTSRTLSVSSECKAVSVPFSKVSVTMQDLSDRSSVYINALNCSILGVSDDYFIVAVPETYVPSLMSHSLSDINIDFK
jgi:hypothetical protein